MNIGYPAFVLIILLAVGIPLAIIRPYKAFLLGCLLIVAGSADEFNATRTSFLGPYLNLKDACVLIGLLGLFVDRWNNKSRVVIPQVLALILFALFVGAMQSFARFGWAYNTVRATSWALAFPIGLFLGANFVNSPHRAKLLIGALLAGVILAALQHCWLVIITQRSFWVDATNYNMIRSIDFLAGGVTPVFLAVAIVWKLPKRPLFKTLYLAAGGLLVLGVFLTQTRSIWFALAATVPVVFLLFEQRRRLVSSLRNSIIVFAACTLAFGAFSKMSPNLDPFGIISHRLFRLDDTSEHDSSAGSRIRAYTTELQHWYEGTLVFGRGLSFFQNMDFGRGSAETRIAFGHAGHATYLSQLGLVGLCVYSIYLPLSIIRRARTIWLYDEDPGNRYLSLLGGGCIIYLSFLHAMSSSLLAPDSFAPGVLCGGVWALSQKFQVQKPVVGIYANNRRLSRGLRTCAEKQA